eukprot:g6178.t1
MEKKTSSTKKFTSWDRKIKAYLKSDPTNFPPNMEESELDYEGTAATTVLRYSILLLICLMSFMIRLFAVVRWESVIHEYDPYFNYRTTKYLANEGPINFLNWFDDRSWYPLGRIVGGTVYPGLMATASAFYWVLHALNITVSVRNQCVFLAPFFAGLTCVATYLLTKEVTRRSSTALLAAAFVGIVPSYISRSVGGSYDNEGVAIFALIFVFYLWVKAVNTGSMAYAACTSIAYFYMVSAWGGYIFIINIVPLYVLILTIAGRYSRRLYVAYTTYYLLGNLLAMQVPFVGFNVLLQAECASSHGIFVMINAFAFLIWFRNKVTAKQAKFLMRFCFFAVILVTAVGILGVILTGKVQFTGRALSLLDPTYAKKYIPIIASVSEHQPTTWTSFFFDLQLLVPLAPAGMYFLFENPTDGKIFVILYGTIAWYFAGVMVRLMLTLAPIACILASVAASALLRRFSGHLKAKVQDMVDKDNKEREEIESKSLEEQSDEENEVSEYEDVIIKEEIQDGYDSDDDPVYKEVERIVRRKIVKPKKKESKKKDSKVNGVENREIPAHIASVIIMGLTGILCFYSMHATYVASEAYSSPSIVLASRRADGSRVIMDDYREAYYWLRQNTHRDAKVLAWWDYGYQMAAMSNRTTLVDNNTWNNTHIATVGRALALSEEDAWPVLDSLDVDYVLVVFGGKVGYQSDDINKFLWMLRIAAGVYDDLKEDSFYNERGQFAIDATATKRMLRSLIYKASYYRFSELTTDYQHGKGYDLVRHAQVGDKHIQLEHIEEAFTSQNWMVRIYRVKKGHEWNRVQTARILKKNRRKFRKDSKDAAKSRAGHVYDSEHRAKYIGCFDSEDYFSEDKIYAGGSNGARFRLAKYHAVKSKKKYFAVARGYSDGHAFAFDEVMGEPNTKSHGCERPCLDEAKRRCGCMDDFCDEEMPEGEAHNRRWTVYKVLPPKKGGDGGGGKSSGAPHGSRRSDDFDVDRSSAAYKDAYNKLGEALSKAKSIYEYLELAGYDEETIATYKEKLKQAAKASGMSTEAYAKDYFEKYKRRYASYMDNSDGGAGGSTYGDDYEERNKEFDKALEEGKDLYETLKASGYDDDTIATMKQRIADAAEASGMSEEEYAKQYMERLVQYRKASQKKMKMHREGADPYEERRSKKKKKKSKKKEV